MISHRFVDSSIAYQGGAGARLDAVRRLHDSAATASCRAHPAAPAPEARRRRAPDPRRDGADLIGGRDADFHRGVAAAFASSPRRTGPLRVIDASGAPEEVTAPARALEICCRDRCSAMTGGRGFRAALDAGRLPMAGCSPAAGDRQGAVREAALRVLAEGAGRRSRRRARRARRTPIAKLIAAGSHPDLMRLERLARTAARARRSISLEQVRSLQRLFATTPLLSPWRAVVIDSVDDSTQRRQCAAQESLRSAAQHRFLLVSTRPSGSCRRSARAAGCCASPRSK